MHAAIHGLNLHYELHGEGEPAVLFIHGFPLSGRMWDDIVPVLKARHRLIVPDLRGFGASVGGADGASMERYALDLTALLDEVRTTHPVVVVGLSMGGYIAFEFYRRSAHRMRALVLCDTKAEADTPEARQGRFNLADKVRREGSAVVAEAMVKKLFAQSIPSDVKVRWYERMCEAPPQGVAAALRAMAHRPDSTPLLPRIHVPTLVVVGAEDAITPPDAARRMQQSIPGAQLEIVEQAGHLPPVEQSDRFARLLSDFLASLHGR